MIARVAKKLKDDSSAVSLITDLHDEELRKLKIKTERAIHVAIIPFTRGVYKDEYWAPVKQIEKKIRELDLDLSLEKAEYFRNPHSQGNSPDGKKWTYSIPFQDLGEWVLTLTASFGPSKVDPKNTQEHLSDAYDLTYSMFWKKSK